MKRFLPAVRAAGFLLIVLAAASSAFAQGSPPDAAPVPRWKPDSFWMSIVSTIVFGGIGIVMAIVGFKLFDLATPGRLDAEVCEKQNLAAAVLSGAMVLGICIIIAAAVF